VKKSSLIFILLMVFHSGLVQADALKNSEFMELSEGQRHWWYAGAYTALGHIVSLDDDKEKTECVWNWFFKDPDIRKAQLVKSFKLYPDHAPTSIVIALLRLDCGVFPKDK